MTQLSTVIKNFILVFKYGERPNEYIGQEQFTRLHDFLMDYKKPQFVDLLDDSGNYKETLKRGDFVLKQADIKYADGNSRWFCGWGGKHEMGVWPATECGCSEQFTCGEMRVHTSADFKHWIKDFMNKDIVYEGDITPEMRARFLEAKKQYAK